MLLDRGGDSSEDNEKERRIERLHGYNTSAIFERAASETRGRQAAARRSAQMAR